MKEEIRNRIRKLVQAIKRLFRKDAVNLDREAIKVQQLDGAFKITFTEKSN